MQHGQLHSNHIVSCKGRGSGVQPSSSSVVCAKQIGMGQDGGHGKKWLLSGRQKEELSSFLLLVFYQKESVKVKGE